MSKTSRPPRLGRYLSGSVFVLITLMWIVTTTGGRRVFVKEVLGEAYDSQAEHLLRRDPRCGRGRDPLRSNDCEWESADVFRSVPGVLAHSFKSYLSVRARSMVARLRVFGRSSCVGRIRESDEFGATHLSINVACTRVAEHGMPRGFCLGSPLLFLLGNLSIYNEAIIWGLAWSVAALFFAERVRNAQGRTLTAALAGFSVCAGCALLSRVTFGAALLLAAPALALPPGKIGCVNFAALAVPLGAASLFHLLLNYAKLGSFTGASYKFYINSLHRDFAQQHGIFNLRRVAYSFADYFSLALPSFHSHPPFISVDRHPLSHPEFFSLPFSETFISLPWSSSWLLLGATMGIVLLVRPKDSDYFQRWIAAALLAQFVCILSYFALAQRYTADLCPFLIYCLTIWLGAGGVMFLRMRYLFVAFVGASIVINSLATAFWLASDGNLPSETRAFWSLVCHK